MMSGNLSQGAGGTPVPPGTTMEQIVQSVYAELLRRQQTASRPPTGFMPASAGPGGVNPQGFNFGISTPIGNVGFGWSSAQPGQGQLSTQSIWGDIGGFFSDAGKTILNGVGQQVQQRLPGMIGDLLKSLAASPEFSQYAQQVRVQSAGPGGALTPEWSWPKFLSDAADTIGHAVTQYVIPNLPTIASTILAVAASQPQMASGQGQQMQQGQTPGMMH
jgi:hypothetical protein